MNCNIYLTPCFSDQSTINRYLSAMANPSAPSEEQLVANLKFMKLSCVGTEDELLKRYNTPMEGMAEVLGHHCREEFKRIWPIQMYQPMEHLRYQAEQISRLESLVESLQEDKLELQKTVKALQVSQESISGR
ncbi:hypothetical protein RvY_18838 [Ramazzottius varieornatus]|uniref:Uncharacterized protein n=1 Tax=Ramazzottius varieornatus TaxID=947166 RepID=A0A1D1WBU0_RAMVA|nr:hypothetical protein RvY_18838 [Ramazzottius varieornatus]